jgi:ABC-type dipeptide/oligopeptide/nickel transport system permease subunit
MFRSLFRALLGNRLFRGGAGIVVVFGSLAFAAPLLTRAHLLADPIQQDPNGLDEVGMPRSFLRAHLLGTDSLGRDVLARVVHGARVSLSIGVAAMLTATVIGVTVGLLAGFYGGRLDIGLMRFTEMNMTIPAVLLAIAFAGLMDGGKVLHLHPPWVEWPILDFQLRRGMVSLFLVIGFVCWPGMVRVIRAQVLELKEREFVQSARALGASDGRLILAHILPNMLPTVIVLSAMNTANTILLEAGLGYLGIGVPPPAPTWGSMISDGQAYFVAAPHIVIAPGLAIVLTVLAFNLLGQGLQEALDPSRTR